jgi:hypothetical protein
MHRSEGTDSEGTDARSHYPCLGPRADRQRNTRIPREAQTDRPQATDDARSHCPYEAQTDRCQAVDARAHRPYDRDRSGRRRNIRIWREARADRSEVADAQTHLPSGVALTDQRRSIRAWRETGADRSEVADAQMHLPNGAALADQRRSTRAWSEARTDRSETVDAQTHLPNGAALTDRRRNIRAWSEARVDRSEAADARNRRMCGADRTGCCCPNVLTYRGAPTGCHPLANASTHHLRDRDRTDVRQIGRSRFAARTAGSPYLHSRVPCSYDEDRIDGCRTVRIWRGAQTGRRRWKEVRAQNVAPCLGSLFERSAARDGRQGSEVSVVYVARCGHELTRIVPVRGKFVLVVIVVVRARITQRARWFIGSRAVGRFRVL